MQKTKLLERFNTYETPTPPEYLVVGFILQNIKMKIFNFKGWKHQAYCICKCIYITTRKNMKYEITFYL